MEEAKTFYKIDDNDKASTGLGGTGVGLGAGALGLGVAALAGLVANKGRGTDVVTSCIPAAISAIPAMTAGTCNEHNKTCVSRDTFDLYREGCENSKDSIRGFATLADSLNQQFYNQNTLVWQDRLTQQAQMDDIKALVNAGIQKQECCCAMLNQRMDYEAQINELKNQMGFNSILCRMPQTTPIQMFPPLPYPYAVNGTTCGACA